MIREAIAMDPAMRDDLLAYYGLSKKPRRVRKDEAFTKHVARIDRAAAHIAARDVVGRAWAWRVGTELSA